GAALRRSTQARERTEPASEERDRERRRSIERRKAQDADALRKMFLAMAEDPRVVIIKIADQLRLLRAMREAADYWRVQDGEQPSHGLTPPTTEPATEPPKLPDDDAASATYSAATRDDRMAGWCR